MHSNCQTPKLSFVLLFYLYIQSLFLLILVTMADMKIFVLSGPSERRNQTNGNIFHLWTAITSLSTLVSVTSSQAIPWLVRGAFAMLRKYGLTPGKDGHENQTINIGQATRVIIIWDLLSTINIVPCNFSHNKAVSSWVDG